MKNKIILLVGVLALLLCLCSCDSNETGVVIKQPIQVAVGTESSADYYAARDFASVNGYELLEYQTRQGAIIAVENGKADYVIINSNDATEELLHGADLRFVENTEYEIEYCAVFNKGDEELKKKFDKAIEELNNKNIVESIHSAFAKGEAYSVEYPKAVDGKLTIICAPVFDNLIYYDEQGDIAGKELSIIKELCRELSVEFEIYVCEDFEEMFLALENGEGDVIISAVEYTDQRAESYLLSEPYSKTQFGVYERK